MLGSGTATRAGLGTFAYMAPEQEERARDVDARADLYSAGLVLYELLAGGLPWDRDASIFEIRDARRAGLPDLSGHHPYVPAAVGEVVMCLLSPEPDGRP